MYRTSLPGSRRFIRALWEAQADAVHARWGEADHDYHVLGGMLERYRPQSLVDVGCGSGRLFALYARHRIATVVGVDISARALAIARRRAPHVRTLCACLEDVDFGGETFDLAICNRVLQHVPPHAIRKVVATLCTVAGRIYVNELTRSDDVSENLYMVRHGYRELFGENACFVVEEGRLGDQTYQVYAHRSRN
jgi:2-polyprenyl-3-methyl-5-hydroxy-6-metoxy-1,4-benzoquinol methylase